MRPVVRVYAEEALREYNARLFRASAVIPRPRLSRIALDHQAGDIRGQSPVLITPDLDLVAVGIEEIDRHGPTPGTPAGNRTLPDRNAVAF
jgi:hypothetical protein